MPLRRRKGHHLGQFWALCLGQLAGWRLQGRYSTREPVFSSAFPRAEVFISVLLKGGGLSGACKDDTETILMARPRLVRVCNRALDKERRKIRE